MNNWCICWFFMHPLNAELNPICHLLALIGGATILVISGLRVKECTCKFFLDFNQNRDISVNFMIYSQCPIAFVMFHMEIWTFERIRQSLFATALRAGLLNCVSI